VIDRIIPEGDGGAHQHRDEVLTRTGDAIAQELAGLTALETSQLVDNRYARFRAFGTYRNGEDRS
jgi:acetyl-CoA carboxylase alpha subunit